MGVMIAGYDEKGPGLCYVQLNYLFHIKGLSVWSLIATQRLKEIFGKRPDMQKWIFGDFYLPLKCIDNNYDDDAYDNYDDHYYDDAGDNQTGSCGPV